MKIENPFLGSVPLTYAGRTVELRFTWHVIAKMQAEFGAIQYVHKVGAIMQNKDVAGLAKLISLATAKVIDADVTIDGPVLSAEDVMQWSPPVVTTSEALQEAWVLSLFGPDKVPEAAASTANPQMARKTTRTLSTLLSIPGFMRVFAGKNSGPSPPTQLN